MPPSRSIRTRFSGLGRSSLAAVERAHPTIVLDPDAEVFQLAIGVAAGGQQLREVTPVDADVMQRAIDTERGEVTESLIEKGGEFAPIDLARGHREGAMMD